MKHMAFDEKVERALEMLREDEDLFCEMVEQLDSWNGFADGFRAWEMCNLNDFYCGVEAIKLISALTKDFNIYDDYFYFKMYGLESTDDKVALYYDNTSPEEVYDEIIENADDITIYNEEFEALIKSIVDEKQSA